MNTSIVYLSPEHFLVSSVTGNIFFGSTKSDQLVNLTKWHSPKPRGVVFDCPSSIRVNNLVFTNGFTLHVNHDSLVYGQRVVASCTPKGNQDRAYPDFDRPKKRLWIDKLYLGPSGTYLFVEPTTGFLVARNDTLNTFRVL
jgi:hypothetical protein